MKTKTTLYIFVEGLEDELFVTKIFSKYLSNNYKVKQPILYSKLPKKTYNTDVIKIMNNIDAGKLENSDYIYLTDFDSKNSINKNKILCVSSVKEKLSETIKEIKKEIIRNDELKKRVTSRDVGLLIDSKKVFVVKEEIESWYLAGVSTSLQKKWQIPENTEETTKENHFDKCIPKKLTHKEFLFEILDNYSLKNAIEHNASLKYFVEKNGIQVQ